MGWVVVCCTAAWMTLLLEGWTAGCSHSDETALTCRSPLRRMKGSPSCGQVSDLCREGAGCVRDSTCSVHCCGAATDWCACATGFDTCCDCGRKQNHQQRAPVDACAGLTCACASTRTSPPAAVVVLAGGCSRRKCWEAVAVA